MTGDAIGRIARRVALQDAIKACWGEAGKLCHPKHNLAVADCISAIQALLDKTNEA